MRTIIAGSRDITNMTAVSLAIDDAQARGLDITEVVCGGARGVDRLGRMWAKANGVDVEMFLPDWSQGRGAGYVRNREMAYYADALVAVWDGKSRGTKNMIQEAKAEGLEVYVYVLDKDNPFPRYVGGCKEWYRAD